MKPDWCRVEIGEDEAPFALAVLASQVELVRLRLQRAGIWPPPVGEIEHVGLLLVGPDDLEDVSEFQGCSVMRVPHWPGQPCVGVPCGSTAQEAYAMARRLQEAGEDTERLHLFGPAGVQYVSVGLVWKPAGERQRNRLLQGVPVDRITRGLMIGVELT